MEIDETKSEPNILYELLILAEWHQNSDIGLQKIALNNSLTNSPSYFNPWKIFEKSKLDNKKFLQTEYAWQLAVSQDGKVIAILQESLLEIRTAKDEYSSVVGKATIPTDQYPQLRKVLWSGDNTFLAVARDNGIVSIYNLLGCIIASIQPFETGNMPSGNSNNILQPVVGLLFLQPKLKSTKWSNELFVFYDDGQVRSILLSSLDGCDSEENANCSLEHYFPQGITSVASHSLHHLVVIAGNCPAKRHGISVWRVLNDYPYLKVASGFENNTPATRSLLRFFPGYSGKLNPNTVIKMKISPNGEILASLHYSGDISIWQLPGIRLIRRWPLSQQPNYCEVNPRNSENIKDEENFHPIDICWWSDSALVIARRSGAITVCSVSTLDNLLGESPEFLSYSPQISSIYGSRSAVVALECEVENSKYKIGEDLEETESERETSVLQASIQAALYSFTDIERFEPKRKPPRILQRVYRLLALKRTTPEELYARKIELEDYGSALLLARTYNLDCDLVYQKQWRTSSVSKENIYDYLDKIKNSSWVVNECIRRVPDTIETARELLEFGLKKTDMDHKLIYSLDSEQKKLVSFRRQILSFLDSLSLYKKIIGDSSKYSAVDYDQFRRKCPIINTVNLARQENWLAVSILFTYKGNEILNNWLPILSNFPETLSPLEYRSLLPEIVENKVVAWDVKQLRKTDWSEDDKYNFRESLIEADVPCDYIYQNDPSLKRFESNVLTPELVEEWYVRRTYEIEKYTGLVGHALSFATLGKERNIKCLDQLLFNLRTLHSLVYVVQDQDITLSKLESLSTLEQAKMLLSKTSKRTFIKDLNNIIYPFAIRCEDRGFSSLYSLIRGLLVWLSEENLDLPLELFKSNKEGSALSFKLSMVEIMKLAIDCLYFCPKSDQVDNGYLVLECLPVRGTSVSSEELELHEKIDKMENHLEICDILQRYKIFKSLHWVLENEENKITGMQLMQDMACYTKEETLNFSDLIFDLQHLQAQMFTSLEPLFCPELVAFTQMSCESEDIILSAANLLQCSREERNKVIPFERSIDLVLKAARIHFEKATGYDDIAIKMSQTCLNLINEPHPQICEELDLIESVQLLQDFHVQVLPLQVRKCNDKMKLIESCLEMKPKAYKSYQRLLQLAHTLRIYGEDWKRREGEVLILLARYALYSRDYEYCSDICHRLVSRNFPAAWPVVCELAQEDGYLDNVNKKEFFAFAILHCPEKNLEELIESRLRLNPPMFSKPT